MRAAWIPASGPLPGKRSATVSTPRSWKRSGRFVEISTCGKSSRKTRTARTAIGSPSTAAKALSRPPIREARPPARTTPATGVRGAIMVAIPIPPGPSLSTNLTARPSGATVADFRMQPIADALDAAAECVSRARYVVALTGAGLSVESGIPPFRGPGGLWTRHGEPPMDGYQRFLRDPRAAWEGRLSPSGPMRALWPALVELEELGVLKATITQNVDNLHGLAGSRRLLEIHGNATLVRCIECVARFRRDAIDFAELPPRCPHCGGILKSDTVSFGEPIPPDVLEGCFEEAERADCMIVAGTFATVYPAAQFPVSIHQRGGDLVEVNPYESEITQLCRHALHGAAGEVLPLLV